MKEYINPIVVSKPMVRSDCITITITKRSHLSRWSSFMPFLSGYSIFYRFENNLESFFNLYNPK